jgi:hypothetical protein
MKTFRYAFAFTSLLFFALAIPAEAQDEPIAVELPDESEWEEGEEAPPEEEPPVEEPPSTPPANPSSPPPPQPQFYKTSSGPKPQPQQPQPVAPPPQSPPPQTMPPAPSPSAPPPADTTAPTDAKQPQLMEEPTEDQKEKEEIFSLFTVAPEVGYIFFPKCQMEVNGISATVDARNGFIGKLHLDIGGDGFAFELAPVFAVEAGGITPGVGFGTGVDLMSGAMMAIGGQLALVYRFELGHFFPNLGLSFHGTYMFGNEIDYGTELYGRIPVGFTVYMGKNVGFVLEVGFMYGVTGIRTPFQMPEAFDTMPSDVQNELEAAQTPEDFEAWYYNNQEEIDAWLEEQKQNGELPGDYSSDQMAADFAADQLAKTIRFGHGFGIDITIGLRFP